MTVRRWEPIDEVPRWRAIANRWGAIALCTLCGAATYRVTLDVLHWRTTPTRDARSVLADPRSDDQERIDAAVMLFNDARLSIDAIVEQASREGTVGVELENLLRHLENAARRRR